MILVFAGMAGAGKTTLAKGLKDKYFPRAIYIEAGAVARGLAEFDKETREALERGDIAPVAKMDHAMRVAISQAQLESSLNGGQHVLLDGYPRYPEQNHTLYDLVPLDEIVVVKISCTDKIATQRLMARKREDDTIDAILARLEFYHSTTEPAIDVLMKTVNDRIVVPNFDTKEEAVDCVYRALCQAGMR